jgi:gliding motility-associated-like protein
MAVKAQPEARFKYNPKIGCAPLTVNFQNQSQPTDQDQTYTWHLGNGETLNKTSPTYSYPEPGRDTNQVRLIADNGFCADTQTQPVTITGFDGRSEAISLTNVTVKDNQHIRLTWQPHPDGQQYQVQRKKPNSPWRNLATTDTNTYLDKQVNVQTQHCHYRIKGLDSCGNASLPSNTGRNILLEGKAKSNESATLQWNPYEEWPQGVSEYQFQKSGQPNNFERLISTTDTTYQDQNYFNPKRDSQYYRVEAIRRGQPEIISTSNIRALPFEARLFIPDAFSPNGDGTNDTFQVNATGIFNYSLKVYNRWGELVYESTNPETGWDGTYNGEQAPTGVYFYTLYATGNFGKPISREGTVQLIR